jgi:hypothetical protein
MFFSRLNSIKLAVLLVFIFGCAKANKTKESVDEKNQHAQVLQDSIKKKKYSLRKYAHVKAFYSVLAVPVTKLCIDENVPPAAVLAMAGLESGWNKGYVGRITGNILSLGARKGDKELPALYLPTSKSSGDVIFDSLEILKHKKSDLIWKKRPKSLKKDYRPNPIAGTVYQLGYFKRHPKDKAVAQLQNITDFLNVFISHKSRIKAYKDARFTLDSLVAKHGKDILLEEKTALLFINAISGRPNTFNYRKTWPKKVTFILKNAGLIPLTKAVYVDKKSFEEVW